MRKKNVIFCNNKKKDEIKVTRDMIIIWVIGWMKFLIFELLNGSEGLIFIINEK